jgi:parvulin-like peptidyl-prolyl isomerase
MPSREFKRSKKKLQGEEKPKEKKKTNPLLYIFSFVILVIIVVTFVGTPIAGRMGRQSKIVFGSYADKDIVYRPGNFLAQQKNMLAERIRQQSQSNNVMTQAYQVWREAFQRTAIHVGILYKADKSGLHVSDELIDVKLTEYGPYVENGEFSEELYQQTSNQQKYTTRQLFRENLKEEQFRRDFFENQFTGDGEKSFVKAMSTPERMFAFVSFSFDEYPLEKVIEYGENNSDLFRRIKLSRIAIQTSEEEARTILEQIENGIKSFEDQARTQSVDSYAEKGGEMGWNSYYELQGDFPSEEDLDRVFALEQGEVSGVIEHEDMWFIYRCDEEPQTPDFTEEEVQNTVRSYMERYEAGMVEDYFVQQANGFRETARNAGFEDACSQHNKTNRYTDYFPINYGNSFFLKQVKTMGESQALQSAPFNEDFFVQAFSLEENQVSEPIVLDRNIVVLQLQDEREAQEKQMQQLDTYYTFIVQQYRDQELRNYFLNSDKLKSNFNSVFSKYLMPKQQG